MDSCAFNFLEYFPSFRVLCYSCYPTHITKHFCWLINWGEEMTITLSQAFPTHEAHESGQFLPALALVWHGALSNPHSPWQAHPSPTQQQAAQRHRGSPSPSHQEPPWGWGRATGGPSSVGPMAGQGRPAGSWRPALLRRRWGRGWRPRGWGLILLIKLETAEPFMGNFDIENIQQMQKVTYLCYFEWNTQTLVKQALWKSGSTLMKQ